jgi:hypothetical protein
MCNNPEVLTYDWIKTGGRALGEGFMGFQEECAMRTSLGPLASSCASGERKVL